MATSHLKKANIKMKEKQVKREVYIRCSVFRCVCRMLHSNKMIIVVFLI